MTDLGAKCIVNCRKAADFRVIQVTCIEVVRRGPAVDESKEVGDLNKSILTARLLLMTIAGVGIEYIVMLEKVTVKRRELQTQLPIKRRI